MSEKVRDLEAKNLITSILTKALGATDDCMTLAEKSIKKNAIIDHHQKVLLALAGNPRNIFL